jgi:hypothetical protein
VTTLCGGGTSAPKAGLPSVVDYAVSTIAELLIFRGVRWPIFALPLIDMGPLTLASFCATDPPALPAFTSDETDAVLQLRFGTDFDSGIAKFKDLVLYTLWYEACECTSGSLTTYVQPTIPSGTPEYQPPVPLASTPCISLGPNSDTYTTGNGNFNQGGILRSGALWTTARITVSTTILTAPGWTQVITPRFDLSAGGQITLPAFVVPAGTSVTRDYAVPQDNTVSGFSITLSTATGTGQMRQDKTWSAYCGGVLPGDLVPCCPPDEVTQATLDILLKMVTLIQRQVAPFAYVYGDNHAGLTGDGEISPVGGLIGVSVDVTAVTSAVGSSAGTPQHLFDVGFITLGTVDGWLKSRRIDADGTLELAPNGAGAITRIGYTLEPGVEVDIRELVRES